MNQKETDRAYDKHDLLELVHNAVGGEITDHTNHPNAIGLLFEKGFYVSIVWHPTSYSSNRDQIYGYSGGKWDETEIRHRHTPPLRAKEFELAIFEDSKLVTGEVFGWLNPTQIIEIIRKYVPYALKTMKLHPPGEEVRDHPHLPLKTGRNPS